ncbi:MAG TPA: porin [Gemmatales bacterium]|nr:porin [Gemmatales bacterium]
MVSSFRRKWPTFMKYAAIGVAAFVFSAAPVSAQDAKQQQIDALNSRLEKLEQQNQKLLQLLEQKATPAVVPVEMQPPSTASQSEDVRKVVEKVLKEKDDVKKADDEKKKKEAAEKGHEVGSDLTASVRWDPSIAGFRIETPNKDFSMHVGGRFQYDSVWFTESPLVHPQTQIGELYDGTFFRRVRMNLDGKFQEVFEYNFEYAFENTQQLITGLDEMWVGITQVPYLGSIRVGHMKVPQGLEGDMVSSSKAMTFMERASYTDAFYNNFAPGIWTGNSVLDQHLTWAAMYYRTERGSNGADFGDGEYAATGRITMLPIYENEGRCLLHLGASSTWRAAELGGNELSGNRTITLQARPELRDAQGDFGNNPSTLPGDTARMVSTGALTCTNAYVNGAEVLAIMGPLSFQAEWALTTLTDVEKGTTRQNRTFNGGYAQVSYFLTGENRLYDRRLGRLGSLYVNPDENFWAVKDEDGNFNHGLGAWELAFRYSYLNLNDGPVEGGVMQGLTVGLNWYLNTNVKLQFDYVDNARWHRDGGSPPGNNTGVVQGFGVRTQILF